MQQEEGEYRAEWVRSDSREESLLKLNQLKNIVASQLLIPREQITKTIFDDGYESVCLLHPHSSRIVGGATLQVILPLQVCNIQYFAVEKKKVRKGLGRKLIHTVIAGMGARQIKTLVTQADEFSIGFYEKNGFIPASRKEAQQWGPSLTEYSNSTLLFYQFSPGIDLANAQHLVAKQLELLKEHLDGVKYRQFTYSRAEIEGLPPHRSAPEDLRQRHKEKKSDVVKEKKKEKKKSNMVEGLKEEMNRMAERERLEVKMLVARLQEHEHSWICEKPLLGKKGNQQFGIKSLSEIGEFLGSGGPEVASRACCHLMKTLEILGSELTAENSSYWAYQEFKNYCDPLLDSVLNGSSNLTDHFLHSPPHPLHHSH